MKTHINLREIATFLPKSKIKAGEGLSSGKYIFFTSSDIKSCFINKYIYDDECIILGTGGKASCNYYNGKFSTSTDNFVIKFDNDYNTKYIYWFLRHNNLSVLEQGFRGSGLKHISKEYVEHIQVPIVELETQEKICNVLEKINNIIQLEENQIKIYDEFIKSRFIEMFGDIERNDKGYQLVEFQHYVSDMHIGPFGSDMKNEVFVDKNNGYSIVYEQKHAIQKSMDLPARYITKEKFLKMQHFVVGPGDIIVSCRGTLGESFVIPEDAPIGVIHPSLMLIKLKHGVNPKFILFILENIFKDKDGRGAGVKMAIKASELSKIKVINPPVNVIEKFISLINFIDKLKFNAQQRIDKYKELLNKKMDEYFG